MTNNTFKQRVIYWGTAITLALIPLTAVASYLTQEIEQQPRSYTECVENNCKVIATITPPPVARYELVVKQALTKTERKLDMSAEEVKLREQRGKDYIKAYNKYNEDGVISTVERFLIVAGI
jgi:hypothetical protein